MYTDLSKVTTGNIISMAHKLGHCTVSERIQHESQLQYLKEHNCNGIRGCPISKPFDEEEAIEFLKRHNLYRKLSYERAWYLYKGKKRR